ncbi:MAG TPA: hypothetical protein VGG74_07035 [Kofleriaceae bacterium]|jgi:hypothetical protein
MARLPVLVAAGLFAARTANADPQATCDRLAAEADSQADVLYSPQIDVQGAHVPVISTTDPTLAAAGGFQARASLGISPTDMWRGHLIQRVASADCKRAKYADELDRILAVGDRYGELASTRAEVDYLSAHLAEVDALVADAEARLEHQRATAVEVDEIRERRTALHLQIAESKETLATLEQLDGPEVPVQDVAALVPAYRDSVVALEREQGSVRELAPWRITVSGGLAEADHADWFAIVDVTYSVGGIWQHRAEDRAADARHREAEHDEHDASVRLEMLRRAMHASALALTDELADVDQMLEKLHADLARLASADDSNDATHQLHARYTIQAIQLEARRASITALVAARRALAGDPQ